MIELIMCIMAGLYGLWFMQSESAGRQNITLPPWFFDERQGQRSTEQPPNTPLPKKVPKKVDFSPEVEQE